MDKTKDAERMSSNVVVAEESYLRIDAIIWDHENDINVYALDL